MSWMLFREVWDSAGLDVAPGRYYVATGDLDRMQGTATLDLESLQREPDGRMRVEWSELQANPPTRSKIGTAAGFEGIGWRMLECLNSPNE